MNKREAIILGKNAQRFSRAKAVIIGLGSLGSKTALLLARSGVADLTLVDRDFVELENLDTQEYSGAQVGLPKAVALQDLLRQETPNVTTHAVVEDVTPQNAESLVSNADIVLDGTDNMQTRYLINEACRKHRVPWVFASCLKVQGMVLAITPSTACYECVFPKPPKRIETCETAGLLNAAAQTAAFVQAAEALKTLAGAKPNPNLVFFDVLENTFEQARVLQRKNCPACRGRYSRLHEKALDAVRLCANSVQVKPRREFDKTKLAQTLSSAGVQLEKSNPFILHFQAKQYEISVFDDGRAIIRGTGDVKKARSVYAKYVGC